MKRITYWLLSTVSVAVLLFAYDGSTSATSVSPPSVISEQATGSDGTTGTDSTGTDSTGTDGTGSDGTGTGTDSTGTTGTTVTGDVASTQWGPVQVSITVKAGRITAVTVPQYPSGNPRDTEINDVALPILTQETMSAQDAGIDMVSGATVTSTGYVQSLQSALDRAGL